MMAARWNIDAARAGAGVTLQAVRQARDRGELAAARTGYQELATGSDATWEVFVEWGEFLIAVGSPKEAVAALGLGARRFPRNPAVLNSLGLAQHGEREFSEAVRTFESALQVAPGIGAIAYNLGNARKEYGDLAGAMQAYMQALELGPPVPEMFNNLGLVLQEVGDTEHALTAYHSALDLDARFLPASLNLGFLHIQRREPEAAVAVLDTAVQYHPENPDAHWLLSHALLVKGDYIRGWKEYEWRWAKMTNAPYRRRNLTRQWTGAPLEGKTILLYAEQGLGDAIQCARYIPMVASAGGTVVVECQPELVNVISTVDGVGAVVPRGADVPPCDVECPLMSLPAIFGTTPETIPAAAPYVRVDESRRAHWHSWLADGPARLHVGLVWAGNPGHRNDGRRSLPASYLPALTAVEGVHWVGLQKGDAGDVRLRVPAGVVLDDAGPHLHDLADTAALLQCMDLVITVDTAVAHLAGALGRRVWILVPYAPDWRWLLEGETTRWYPTARLYRQPTPGNWDAVIGTVRSDLRTLLSCG
jgi:tetratricopeptide (TPR) repeat protein